MRNGNGNSLFLIPVRRWTFCQVGGPECSGPDFHKYQVGFHASFTEERLSSCHSAINPKSVVLQWCCSSRSFSHPRHGISGAQPDWPLGSWSPLFTRPFSPDCSVWPGSQLYELWRALCSWEPSMQHNFILQHSPDLCQSLSSVGSTFNLMGFVFALICVLSCETLYRKACDFPNHVQSIEFTTGGPQSRFWDISKMIKRNGRHLR